MILGFFFLFHFLEALSGREGFFAKKGGVSLVRNRDLRPAAKANPTIQQAFERFQKYNRLKNLSQGSLDFYAAKGRSFFRFLGDTEQPITTITEETVEDYIFYMKDQQLHDTTINTNLRMVRAFLYWCMEKSYLEKYPIRLVRADDPIKEPYTTDELQKLLKEPDCKTCSFAEYRNWVIVNFLLGTGCRASTLLNLHIDPASLTEEERQQKLQEILDCIKASRKRRPTNSLIPLCRRKNRKPPGQLHSLQNSTSQILLVRITRTGMGSWCLMRVRTPARPILF